MAQKIAIVNNKGGSTKTTTTVNIAGAIHRRAPQARILVADGDGQGNSGRSFKVNPNKIENTIYEVFMGESDPEDVIFPEVYDHIDLLPANSDMNFFEFDKMLDYEEDFKQGTYNLIKRLAEENVDIKNLTYEEWEGLIPSNISITNNYFNLLEGKFDKIDEMYDFILFDTPPEVKSVTSSILSIADQVIIPFEPDIYSVDGIVNIMDRIKIIQKDYNPNLKIAGLLPVKVNTRTNLHNEVQAKVFRYASLNNIPFFGVFIPMTIKFANSTAHKGLPATLSTTATANKDKMVQSYFDLLDEMVSKKVINLEV
ncbi:ParA family protein [Enterococcus mundtii]|uniref:ParA family protein n=1 Tax=Enterococcus mundtii TaxID=53346 RepID=UPI001A979962|nr:AAA family ATPase [Enterococcus mundtii]MBO1087127.1 AAA family ATPase [Enterococcus mundtii]